MTVQDEIEKQRRAAEAKVRGLQEWQLDAMRAVPDSLIRDIVGDARRGISTSASMIPDKRADGTPRAPSGGTTEIKPPPGVNYVDALCDAQDRRDRLAAIRQAAENAEIERRLDRKDHSYQAHGVEYNPFSKQMMDK
jgi:hypothetical protein